MFIKFKFNFNHKQMKIYLFLKEGKIQIFESKIEMLMHFVVANISHN